MLQWRKNLLLEIENDVVTVDVAIAKWAKLAQIQTGFIYDEQGVAMGACQSFRKPAPESLAPDLLG